MRKSLRMCKRLNYQRNAHGSHLDFQNEAKNIPRQAFVIMNISCKFENSAVTFPLGLQNVGKVLALPMVVILFLKMRHASRPNICTLQRIYIVIKNINHEDIHFSVQ